MKISTIVFDLDGTLMDTLQDLAESTNYALRAYGFPQHGIEAIRSFVGNGVRKLIERAVPQGTENPLFEEVFRTFKEHYVAHCRDHSGLYAGISEMLQALADSGYRLAVVSNKLQAGVTELQQYYFSSWIQVAVGERPEVRRKPAPDMVLQAVNELGADRSTWEIRMWILKRPASAASPASRCFGDFVTVIFWNPAEPLILQPLRRILSPLFKKDWNDHFRSVLQSIVDSGYYAYLLYMRSIHVAV